MKDERKDERVLFFEIDGLTRVVRGCDDIEDIEMQKKQGFTHCPVCGGKRVWENGQAFLMHDPDYTSIVQ